LIDRGVGEIRSRRSCFLEDHFAMTLIRKILNDQEGATAIEYGLIAALVATGAIIAMGALGNSLSNTFTQVSTKLNNASDGKGPF
jgi:pilus assembly protein Flp/PilA